MDKIILKSQNTQIILRNEIFLKIIGFLEYRENIEKTLKEKGVFNCYAQEKNLRMENPVQPFPLCKIFKLCVMIPTIPHAISNSDCL